MFFFWILLLTFYFAFARELSFGGHVLVVGGLVVYWLPRSFLENLFEGWNGVVIGVAFAAGVAIYLLAPATRASRGDRALGRGALERTPPRRPTGSRAPE